jgi:hypothetical protein
MIEKGEKPCTNSPCLPGVGADCSPRGNSGGSALVRLSTTRGARNGSRKGGTRGTWGHGFLSGILTCESSPGLCSTVTGAWLDGLTSSSAAGSRAKTSAPQENRQGLTGSAAGSMQKCYGSLARWDRDTCSWRTSQLSLLDQSGPGELLENWPSWGTTADGALYPLPTPVLPTCESGGSVGRRWGTPCESDYKGVSRPGQKRDGLGDNLVTLNWASPLRGDAEGGRTTKGAARQGETGLRRQVANWATPTHGDAAASGSRNTAASNAHPGESLTDMVRGDGGTGRKWTTPQTHDRHKGDPARAERGTAAGGCANLVDDVLRWTTPQCDQLNPDWEEILMGWPGGWTSSEPCAGVWPGWPAPRPADPAHDWQYDYEPPRVCQRGKDWARRVAAIGDGIVPQALLLALQMMEIEV